MMNPFGNFTHASGRSAEQGRESGFALTEFLVSAVILLILSAAVFTMLSEIQRTASYQTEVQAVLNNVYIAMQTLERRIRQAGNDPYLSGLAGISIVSSTEVRIQSDLTGSAAPGNPDKGDPDGDCSDSGENLTIRYNNVARTIEVVPDGSSAQIIAGYISGLSLSFFDAGGNETNAGNSVRAVKATISGTSTLSDPQTHRRFGVQISSEIRILT
jgi:type II secretory pathway pseudopilin PulG